MFKRFFRMPARQYLKPNSPLAAAINWLVGLVVIILVPAMLGWVYLGQSVTETVFDKTRSYALAAVVGWSGWGMLSLLWVVAIYGVLHASSNRPRSARHGQTGWAFVVAIGVAAFTVVGLLRKDHLGPEGATLTDLLFPIRLIVDPDLVEDATIACDGQAVANAATYQPSDETIHPVIVLDDDGEWIALDSTLPLRWRPDEIDDLELVACVEQSEEQATTCSYTDGTSGTVYNIRLDIRLVAAHSGETVAEFMLLGENDGCPGTISGGGGSFEQVGDVPDIVPDLAFYVEPDAPPDRPGPQEAGHDEMPAPPPDNDRDTPERAADLTFQAEYGVSELVFSADGQRLAVGGAGLVEVWDVVSGGPIARFEDQYGAIDALAFSLDGDLLVTGASDGSLKVRDLSSGDILLSEQRSRGQYNTAAFNPDGSLLALGATDGQVTLIDVATGDVVRSFGVDDQYITQVVFHPNGGQVAAVSQNDVVRVWNASTGALLRELDQSGQLVAFSADGSTLTTGGIGGRVMLYDVMNGYPTISLDGNPVTGLGFGQENTRLWIVRGHDTVEAWDARSGDPLEAFTTGVLVEPAFSPDGTLLAAGGNDNTVRVWRLVGE